MKSLKKEQKEKKEKKEFKTGYYFDYKEKLTDEYRTTFDKVEDYCKMQLIDSAEINDSMSYLMDIFLQAQEDGLPVQKITGGNIEDFCKCFLSDISAKGRVRAFFEQGRVIAWIFLLISVIFYLLPPLTQGKSAWDVLSSAGSDVFCGMALGLLFSALLDVMARAIVRQMIFKMKKYRRAYSAIVSLLVYAVGIVSLNLIPDFEIDLPGVPDIPLGITPLFCVVWLAIAQLVIGFLNVGDGKPFFAKGEKLGEQQLSFRATVLHDMVEEGRKMFEKGNQKREKKGKPMLTQEEFLEKYRKDTKKQDLVLWLTGGICALIYLGFIIQVAMTSTPMDTVIFTVILIAVYFIFMYPLSIYPNKVRRQFQQLMDESGKSFFDEDFYDVIDQKVK